MVAQVTHIAKGLGSISVEASYYVLAGELEDHGDLDAAIRYYNKALRQEKNDPFFLEKIHLQRGRIYTKQKKYSLALSSYDNAIKYSIRQEGDDSHAGEYYVAKREIHSILGDEGRAKEMDKYFASAVDRYKKQPPHVYNTKKFQDIGDRLERMIKQNREVRKGLFKMLSLTIEDRYSGKSLNYKELENIIDEVLNEIDTDNTFFNKEERALEKAYMIKYFNEFHTQ